ncbi:MAG: helix-turn-helix domain-containing protein [Clostridiales bacterium]|nr:helix-turn-helix domain-containing protein [Clostridiales bacterium]
MNNNLASNIRTFRKEQGLTQEQLAEVFDVTVGAVHKWEAGLSVPDLKMLMEIADFFDTSLDVLTGFDIRDNRISVLAERLSELQRTLDPNGPSEAEKALKKYPHSFEIVRHSAYLYLSLGTNRKVNRRYLNRSRELFEEAIRLFSQNEDPLMSKALLYGQLAMICQLTGDIDKSLQIYKAHNAGGMFNVRIGQVLALNTDRYEEAEEHLSWALAGTIGDRLNILCAKAFCCYKKGDYDEARAVIEASLQEHKIYGSNGPDYLDRIDCICLTGLACIELREGHRQKASKILKEVRSIAERFDADPNYSLDKIRFMTIKKNYQFSDINGETCMDVVESVISILDCPELLKTWRILK